MAAFFFFALFRANGSGCEENLLALMCCDLLKCLCVEAVMVCSAVSRSIICCT